MDNSKPKQERIKITADKRGVGNAKHHYVLKVPGVKDTEINFQEGPMQEVGLNGIHQEDLLKICIDRLKDFQSGDFACRENELALTHIQTGLMWLEERTRNRVVRGVEGYNIL